MEIIWFQCAAFLVVWGKNLAFAVQWIKIFHEIRRIKINLKKHTGNNNSKSQNITNKIVIALVRVNCTTVYFSFRMRGNVYRPSRAPKPITSEYDLQIGKERTQKLTLTDSEYFVVEFIGCYNYNVLVAR